MKSVPNSTATIFTLIEGERSKLSDSSVITVGDLIARLTNGVSASFKALFDVYLELNPEEALALIAARPSEAGLLTSARLTQAMRQPELVTIGMRQVINQEDPERIWATALVESALRYELVARMLAETAAPSSLQGILDNAHVEHRWHVVQPVAGSVYGAVLNLATESARPDREVTDISTLVPFLAQVPAFGKPRLGRRMLGSRYSLFIFWFGPFLLQCSYLGLPDRFLAYRRYWRRHCQFRWL